MIFLLGLVLLYLWQ